MPCDPPVFIPRTLWTVTENVCAGISIHYCSRGRKNTTIWTPTRKLSFSLFFFFCCSLYRQLHPHEVCSPYSCFLFHLVPPHTKRKNVGKETKNWTARQKAKFDRSWELACLKGAPPHTQPTQLCIKSAWHLCIIKTPKIYLQNCNTQLRRQNQMALSRLTDARGCVIKTGWCC